MTLNDVMAVILRYFTEFGKHMRSNTKPRRSVAEFMHESIVFCIARCRRKRKFTFAISSPDQFLVILLSSYKFWFWTMAMIFFGIPYCSFKTHPQCWSDVSIIDSFAKVNTVYYRSPPFCHFFYYFPQ